MAGSSVSTTPTTAPSYGCRVTFATGAGRRPGQRPWSRALPQAEAEIRFRGFRLLPAARVLLRDGTPLEVGSRAFDLLHVLARARGSLVSKDEILRQVWPTTLVEESNLRFQVAVLRKALGRDRDIIKTVPGRGYHFAAEFLHGPVAEAVRPAEAVRQGPGRAEPGEAIEALRGLLQLVLDELREMSGQAASSPAVAIAGE